MFGRKVKIKWLDEEYELIIEMDGVVEEVDNELNILQTSMDINKQVPKATLVAKLYAILLKYAGADVTKEEVYISMMKNPAGAAELITAARVALDLFYPEIESSERTSDEKKVEG